MYLRPFLTTGHIATLALTASAAFAQSGAVIGTGPGVGSYTLNRIEVNRTYASSVAGPGTILPGKQTYLPGQSSFQLGWNYKWPDSNTGPNLRQASQSQPS